MVIQGCPRGNDKVSQQACEGCEYLVVEDETIACTLPRSLGSSGRGRKRLRGSGIDLSRQSFPGEDPWFPPPPPERNETPMASQEDGQGRVNKEAPSDSGSDWKRMFLDEKLEAVEDSIVEYDPTMPPEHPDIMDLVEMRIERTWVPPSDDTEEPPPETSPEIGEPSTDPLPGVFSSSDDPMLPLNPPADDPFLNPEELTDPFGRPLPPLPEDVEEEFGPGMP